MIPASFVEALTREVGDELDRAIALAEAAGLPKASTIFDGVFAELPSYLAAQRRTLTGG